MVTRISVYFKCVCVCVCVCEVTVWCSGCVLGSGPEVLSSSPTLAMSI